MRGRHQEFLCEGAKFKIIISDTNERVCKVSNADPNNSIRFLEAVAPAVKVLGAVSEPLKK